MTTCDVAIIGAGPFGLSIAAYLKARGLDFRIFGSPMYFWRTHMPKGMRLKSEGFASSLYDPNSTFTLGDYCRQEGIPYTELGLPVSLDTFVSYGLEFQKRFVPELENKLVVSVRRSSAGFQIRLEDGEVTTARRVVVGVGLTYFAHVPPILSALPDEFVSHSSRHHALDRFKGGEIAVIGAGASALDLAALLYQAGASVQVVARTAVIRFHDPPGRLPRPLLECVRLPMTGIGSGWKLFFCTNAPHLFHQLPQRYRLEAVKWILGPAPAWFVKEQVVGKVPLNLGFSITGANVENGRVSLQLANSVGTRRTLVTDHVIAATGYKVDLRRLTFLDPDVRAEIRSVEHTPVLSSNFESSVSGLYFVGISSANSFGPLMRFSYGARFTAQRLSSHLAKSACRSPVQERSALKIQALERDEACNR